MSQNPSTTADLLPEGLRRRFEPLMLVAKRIRSGAMKGERRSVKRGTSIEFADYRAYTPGDDLRKLDWNVYARSDRPTIKLLEDEEDLAVHILLDASGSMDWQPEGVARSDADKFLFARRLLAGLAYISLTSGDRLTLSALSDASSARFGPVRGRGQVVAMLRFVQALSASGTVDLNRSLRDFALREKRPGLVILISDLLAPEGFRDGLNVLLGKGHEVVLLHTLTPDEVMPPLAGDLRLIDVETGRPQEVTIDAAMRDLYQRRLTAWLDDIRNEAGRRGVHYVMMQTDTPFEKAILFELRRMGVVK